MRRSIPAWAVALVFVAGVAWGAPRPAATAAEPASSVADLLAAAMQEYQQGEYDKGLRIAQEVFERAGLSREDRIATYSVLGTLTYAKGRSSLKESIGYLKKIVEIDPCAVKLPAEYWARDLRVEWYKLLGTGKEMRACPTDLPPPGVRTLAVLGFENHSTGKYLEELGQLTGGLAEMFAMSFAEFSDLKVVERDRLDALLEELQLSDRGVTTAVRAGRLLGAQIMVFGSVIQQDERTGILLVRAVNVETSEIIGFVQMNGRPKDYFQKVGTLAKELSVKLDLVLTPEVQRQLDQVGSASADALTMYAKGLYHLDVHDYATAYQFFEKACQLDPNFAEARHKLEVYGPLVARS